MVGNRPFARLIEKSTLLVLLVCFGLSVAPVAPGAAESGADSQSTQLYKVEIRRGQRRTISGKKRSYTLYLPQANGNLPGPPYPLLVIAHGFLMSGTQQSNNSRYFAERGIAVLSPNITRILWGDKNRVRNIKDILDQMNWVLHQNKDKNSFLYGQIDPERVGSTGNSSGGAVALELVIQAQKAKVPVHAFCSMDGAVWDRSLPAMPGLTPLKTISLRAEPSICNEHARMLDFLRQTKFSFDDIKIIGARHCDAENPTTIRCECICGRSRPEYRRLFQLFTYLFFRDAFHTPKLSEPTKDIMQVAKDLETDGKVVVTLDLHGTQKATAASVSSAN